jgi:hypothetical protein
LEGYRASHPPSFEISQPLRHVFRRRHEGARTGRGQLAYVFEAKEPIRRAGQTNSKLDEMHLMKTRSTALGVLITTFLCAVPQMVQATVDSSFLTNGLVAYYPFAGNADDVSGRNDGTVHGAVLTTDRLGDTNAAYAFTATASPYIEMQGPLPEANSATFSVWVTPPGPGSQRYVFFENDGGPGSQGFYLAFNTSNLLLWGTKDGSFVGTPDQPSDTSQWYQIVGVANATNRQMSLWVNAKLMASGAFNGGATAGHTYHFEIGRRADPFVSDTFYQGKIDDFRFYNRALTDGEVAALYQFEHIPPPELTITVKTVRVDLKLVVGQTYQLESSKDLITWTPVGAPFQATATTVSQDFDVTDYGQFFRVLQVSQ